MTPKAARESVASARDAYDAILRDEDLLAQIDALAERVAACIRSGGKVWLFGNGGSAADAQHIAAELVGRFRRDRRALPAEALTVNTSTITAIANDFGFEEVFARQVEAHGRAGDVAVGISTSGASENVRRGLATAAELGLHTVALTGRSGGAIGGTAADWIAAPADDTPRIQECHVLLAHVLCDLVERRFTGDGA